MVIVQAIQDHTLDGGQSLSHLSDSYDKSWTELDQLCSLYGFVAPTAASDFYSQGLWWNLNNPQRPVTSDQWNPTYPWMSGSLPNGFPGGRIWIAAGDPSWLSVAQYPSVAADNNLYTYYDQIIWESYHPQSGGNWNQISSGTIHPSDYFMCALGNAQTNPLPLPDVTPTPTPTDSSSPTPTPTPTDSSTPTPTSDIPDPLPSQIYTSSDLHAISPNCGADSCSPMILVQMVEAYDYNGGSSYSSSWNQLNYLCGLYGFKAPTASSPSGDGSFWISSNNPDYPVTSNQWNPTYPWMTGSLDSDFGGGRIWIASGDPSWFSVATYPPVPAGSNLYSDYDHIAWESYHPQSGGNWIQISSGTLNPGDYLMCAK
jgi:hypothetical protein